ncbi:MAG TPA: TetR family transcriptional regulator [Gaiellaceae bacterium]|nr:TetR family transcriptional regulator [Gaiellaceae bacterium]
MSNTEHGLKRRRSGRRPGASGSREAILTAASRHFASRGYNRASLRGIAADAGVDQKLIAYFFGSKQQLFVAAIGLPFNPAEVLPEILAGDPTMIGERIEALLVEVLSQPALHERLTGVIRAAASEPDVARMMREFLRKEVFIPVARVLGSDDATFRLNLVGTQIVGLMMARYVLEIEPLASLPPKQIAAAVAPTLQRYLVGPLIQT